MTYEEYYYILEEEYNIVVKNDDTGNALFKAVEYIISIDLTK